jgi:hypothetical protein
VLSGVTISCFLLSYLLVLFMEASRIFLKFPGRNVLLIGMLVVGLIAHSIFLANQLSIVTLDSERPQLLSNWFQWAVLGAWGLALACLILTIRNPNGSMGLFLIPLVLALIGLAQLLRNAAPFHPETTINIWRAIHGVSLLVSTMFIALGLAFGMMYLVQSHRLKTRRLQRTRIKLPALEFLQSMNRLSLFSSAGGLVVGLLSGIVLNFNREGQISWLSGDILFTFALFAWVLSAAVVELTSRGALGGRRSAYLVIANFIFMVFVLSLVLYGSHGQPASGEGPSKVVVRSTMESNDSSLTQIIHEYLNHAAQHLPASGRVATGTDAQRWSANGEGYLSRMASDLVLEMRG